MESLSEELMSFESFDGEELNEGNAINKAKKGLEYKSSLPGYNQKFFDTSRGPNKQKNKINKILAKNPTALGDL